MKQSLQDTTFGVTSTGNMKALLLCLSSVIMQSEPPGHLLVRLEGEFPAFGEFYLEQLVDLARQKSITFNLTVARSNGVREARDWLLDNCRTYYLWMGDDDVVYDARCLEFLYWSMQQLRPEEVGFIVGTKPDVNNRRGYGDFTREPLKEADAKDYCSYNQFYDGRPKLVRMRTADTGNLLMPIPTLFTHQIRFSQFRTSANASGEDTLFAGACAKAKLQGWCQLASVGYHLEKPTGGFNDFGARTEMLYRAFELKGYDSSILEDFMPFQKRHHHQ
jgi:hypothetical protein